MADRPLRAGLALVVLAAMGCFNAKPDDIAGGGGVETTEGNLASLAADPAGARVSLIPADFDPLRDALPDSLTVLAGAEGAYRFRGLAPGRYNLEAYHPGTGTRCFRPGLVIAEGRPTLAGTDTLTAPGRLRLTWDGVRRGVLTQPGRFFRLDLNGLDADSGGVTLDSLPAGLLPPFSFTDAFDPETRPWTDSVRIAPGRLDSVPIREEWAHAAVLALDTSDFIPDSLDGYPLLVRLQAPDFTFSEAASGGSDLRFTAEDGDVLPHAVEGWDSAAGRAEIWVRLKAPPDGGFGRVRMHWGKPGAGAYRAGSVFDSASGFAGVWHLGERSSEGRLADAGPLALPTSASGLVPEFQGAIGTAQRFDGIGAYAAAADEERERTPGHLCVSAWIAPDTGEAPAEAWTILSNWRESDSTGFILAYLPDSKSVRLTLGFGAKVVLLQPVLGDIAGTWHLVEATYDGTEAAVMFDGAKVSARPAGPEALPLPSGQYLIGARGSADPQAAKADFFRGGIDEARVFRSAPDRAWHSLDFRTQAPGSKLLGISRLR